MTKVKLQVEFCRPAVTEPSIVWNAERGCHCHPPKPEAEMLESYSDPRIKLMEETIVMHVSVVMVNE